MATWFEHKVIDLVGTLSRLYYTGKYGAMAQQLGRMRFDTSQQRGFIIVQIDGLSYEHLMEAVERGYMPYVGRLIASGRLTLTPWQCGIPSTTPAVQAGLMFGNRHNIPGFRWYDKHRRFPILTRRPDQAREIRTLISQGRPGILRGGSCYVSIFDGDADLALFTLSTFHSQHFFESVRGMGLFLLFLLSPFRLLRVTTLIAASYLSRLARRLGALIRPAVVNPLDIFSPLLQSVSDVLFTEVQTFGVLLDIYRGVPAIYANYTGYDEIAHAFGPNHPAALRTLRGIDRCIRQINRMRVRPEGRGGHPPRLYDLYLIADHGNAASVPFAWLHEKTLGHYIVSRLGQEHVSTGSLQLCELVGDHSYSTERARYLLEEWRGLEQRLSPRLRRVLAMARLYIRRRLAESEALEYDLHRQGDVVVSASGPLAHVYFNITHRPLDLIEVMLLYPRLLDELLATPGIGAIAGRAERRTIVLGASGGVLAIGDGEKVLEGQHPLASYGNVAYAEAQLHRLTHFPHAGDLVVLGAMRPDGRVVTFEKQMASHGGIGGVQTAPFIACSPPGGLDTTFDDAEELYTFFMERYHLAQQETAAERALLPIEIAAP